MAHGLAHDENKTKALVKIGNEVESGSDPLTLAFENGVLNHGDFVKHKDELLRMIDDALKICSGGNAFNRLSYIRKRIDVVKAPSELRYMVAGSSQNVFSQHLSLDQPPTYYLHAKRRFI